MAGLPIQRNCSSKETCRRFSPIAYRANALPVCAPPSWWHASRVPVQAASRRLVWARFIVLPGCCYEWGSRGWKAPPINCGFG